MAAPQSKRKWYQFSLLSLLIFTSAAAVGVGIYSIVHQRIKKREAALATITEIMETYDGYAVESVDFSFAKPIDKRNDLTRFLLALESCDDAQALHLEGSGADDQHMKQIGSLGTLTGLNLRDTKTTDRSLEAISALNNLTWINLENCAVTDAGLKPLSELSKLEFLEIEGTQITPEGKQWIKERLPQLQINPKFGNAASTNEP